MKIPRIKLLRLPFVTTALMVAALVAPAAPVAQAANPPVAIHKVLCIEIGKQNTCNGRDSSLSGYSIDFKVYAGAINSVVQDGSSGPPALPGSAVEVVTVILNENSLGNGNVGNGSQGRKVGTTALTTGSPYTVCEVPVAYLGATIVGLVPTPRPDLSTGGVNQTGGSQDNSNCIQVTPTSGKAEAKFLDKKAPPPPPDCNVENPPPECKVGGQASVTTFLHTGLPAVGGTGPIESPISGPDPNSFPCSLLNFAGCDLTLVVGFPPHVPLGTDMRDDALVDAVSDFPIPANSTLDFYFYSNYNGICPTSASGTPFNTQNIGGTQSVTVFSPNTGALHAGDYAFQANYKSTNEAQVTSKLGDCEPFVVDKGTATISTAVHNEGHTNITSTTVQLGSTVHDTATATGSFASFVPAGTVDFSRYGDNSLNQAAGTGLNCAGTATSAGTGNLGADPGSSSFGPLFAGSYGFTAGNYSGDSDYLADTSTGACEPFAVAKSGALTMGFWTNQNGQGIIKGEALSGVCPSANSTTGLRQYAPFQDLSPTATCSDVAAYVIKIKKAANASGATMIAMLKGQVLATALDVYFSTTGNNKINAPFPIGGLMIDLTNICKPVDNPLTGTATCGLTIENTSVSFGGTSPQTVGALLIWAAAPAQYVDSTHWYGNVKSYSLTVASQEAAKDTFDAINNQLVA